MSDSKDKNQPPALREAQEILLRNLEISASVEEDAGNPSHEELKRLIAGHVRKMLHQNYERLLNLLYRIDVPEAKVAEALSEYPPNEAPEALADMIIERQLQKVITRQQYRK